MPVMMSPSLLCLAVLAATAAWAQARTEVREHATLRYGLGGDFAAHGFGNTGFIAAGAQFTPARVSLPDDIGVQGHPQQHWDDPFPQFNDLYLTGGSARPGIVPRRAWWSERSRLWLRLSVPRCLRVTLYLLDTETAYPHGPANIRLDAGTPGERLFHVEDARSGVYLSFNMTVGSANMTIEKTNGQTGFGALVAGVFFDELPAGSSCALSRPRTAPWTLEQGGATLLYNAGGYMSTLGFGGRAYWLPPADLTSAPVTSFPSAGYAIDVSRPYVVGSNIHMPSDDRLLTPPGSERRRSLNIQGRGGGDLTFTVTVPRCSLVRLYVMDLYDNIQEAEIRRPGKPTVRLSHGLLQGVWVTFTQETGTAQYITNKVSGPNLPLSAVAVDDGPADCAFVTPVAPPPSTPVPPPTPVAPFPVGGSEPAASRNANGENNGDGSNTVVIAVVAALAVGAICIAVAIGIVLAARRANNNRNDNADDGAEMGDSDERGGVPVVGAVVGEPRAPAVLQCPEPQHAPQHAPPPAYGYPPNTAHTPAHFAYPVGQPQPSYGYPPQPPVLDDGVRGAAAAAGDSPDRAVLKTTA